MPDQVVATVDVAGTLVEVTADVASTLVEVTAGLVESEIVVTPIVAGPIGPMGPQGVTVALAYDDWPPINPIPGVLYLRLAP